VNSRMLERFREYVHTFQFNAIRVGVSSPEKIRSLSYGEVKKIETINYRTLKPERDGLFCARIFGPIKDWECNCGKYKRMKHRGVTCEKCGVEVIQSKVRRERMGHVNLVSPVCNIWYLKGIPSYLSLILGMTVKDLEKVIYFDSYVVLNQGSSPYPQKTILNSQEYEQYVVSNKEDVEFKTEMGAEAIRELLAMIDLEFETRRIEDEYEKQGSVAVKIRLAKRYKVLHGLLQANIRPEWVILKVLPVIPPDLRPLVSLEGGRFASSDLNDLYRRVLNRNIRLKRLIELVAPDVIIKNEKRMLQESVDALIDNGRRGQAVRGSNKRPLKSLSEMLRGKQGRFRQNLLGKRVDYSGRSVIVVDPELKMHQCGLPKLMALELFKPYVYVELQKREVAANLRSAKKMVEEMDQEIWGALEEVVNNRPVLLNRAPTLHRLSVLAFYPILVEGKAIKIHPLVCAGFNADFDGDQMAVHVLLSEKSQKEAITLMLSTNNILSPSNGKPVAIPSQDIVLGLYYITKGRKNVKGEGLVFANIEEVIYAYQRKIVDVHALIKLRIAPTKFVDTTVGRVLLYEKLPRDIDFSLVNRTMKKKDVGNLVASLYKVCGPEKTVTALDAMKHLGFLYATLGGISLSIDNLVIPKNKYSILEKSKKEVSKTEQLYMEGSITNGERYNKIIQIWAKTTEDVTNEMLSVLEKQDEYAFFNEQKKNIPFNSVFMMLDSGARSSRQQIRQLAAMRGLMAKPSGEIMETPVLANFKEGLTVFEYFVSTHGARKGLADTALKTADAGYLTRRLVDVAQDVVVAMSDCQTLGYVTVSDIVESGVVIETLAKRIYGRISAEDVKDPVTQEIIIRRGVLITTDVVDRIVDSAVTEVSVRSVLACQAKRGTCVQCYGMDLANQKIVDVGVAVGIIAAQSIGEPGTQLTLRTFHIGGTASGMVEQSYYKTRHNGKIVYDGVKVVKNANGKWVVFSRKSRILIVSEDGRELEECKLSYGSVLFVDDKQQVTIGTKIAEWELFKVILTDKKGKVGFVDLIENITYQESFDDVTKQTTKVILAKKDEQRLPSVVIYDDNNKEVGKYFLPVEAIVMVEDGKQVSPGDLLAKLPKEEQKTKDITGGLPRVAELFEARIPKNAAIVSEVDGEVSFGGFHRGYRRIVVTDGEGNTYEYNIPRAKHISVEDGEMVKAGDVLCAGVSNVHDILKILGPDEVQKYLVREIQEIYSLQGVELNDKHIELIVRQMLRKVKIIESGDTSFVVGDRIDKAHLQAVNTSMAQAGKRVAVAKPILMGITKSSLETESFFSAASFQETTRVLTEASLAGQVDYLYGLKENVVIGKLIPAGTGIKSFKKKYLGDDVSDFEKKAQEEEELEIGLDKISLKGSIEN
jgi:DNA-directed RNA polymerase subunit beta'